MGRIRLLIRLVIRDLRRRPGQSAMLFLVIAATTTTLTVGLALGGVTASPWDHTRAVTAGPDVTVTTNGGYPAAFLAGLPNAPGVRAAAGPYLLVTTSLRARGQRVDVDTEARDVRPAAIDQPAVTAGSWIRPGGVVIERGLADALGVTPGDRITLKGRPFQVAGIAVTAARATYPNNAPGLVWITTADSLQLLDADTTVAYVLNLRLASPDAAPAFAAAHTTDTFFATPWQDIRDEDAVLVLAERVVLVVGSWLLGLLALASLAVLVGARLADQARRIGLLKAVGATSRFIAVLLLAEYLIVALAAAVVGLVAGRLAAPLLTNPGAGLVGAPDAPLITASTVAIVIGVAVAITCGATLVPALRGARTSTLRALAHAATPPRRHPRVNALSAKLPAPLLLGMRLAARRPRRAVLSVASLLITVAMIVVALTIQHTLSTANPQLGNSAYLAHNAFADKINQVATVLTVGLVLLAAANALFVTWATIVDSRRPAALARAFGATPRQVSAGLSAAQLIPALPAALLGIPAGLGLFNVVITIAGGSGTSVVTPPTWSLASVLVGTLVAVMALTLLPARIGANRPVAEVLRTE
jgi:putative ABC transport system permease protein